mmetsp:Transcript_34922/g.96447  ORF Transcript_34922/g.96447 Transcript_34922/m.96447 type:complete len:320 (+) Transcript_34922:2034-2993(+)
MLPSLGSPCSSRTAATSATEIRLAWKSWRCLLRAANAASAKSVVELDALDAAGFFFTSKAAVTAGATNFNLIVCLANNTSSMAMRSPATLAPWRNTCRNTFAMARTVRSFGPGVPTSITDAMTENGILPDWRPAAALASNVGELSSSSELSWSGSHASRTARTCSSPSRASSSPSSTPSGSSGSSASTPANFPELASSSSAARFRSSSCFFFSCTLFCIFLPDRSAAGKCSADPCTDETGVESVVSIDVHLRASVLEGCACSTSAMDGLVVVNVAALTAVALLPNRINAACRCFLAGVGNPSPISASSTTSTTEPALSF